MRNSERAGEVRDNSLARMLPAERLRKFLLGRISLHTQKEGLGWLSRQRDREGLIKSLGVVEDARIWYLLCQWPRSYVIFKGYLYWGDRDYALGFLHNVLLINHVDGLQDKLPRNY